MQDALFPPPPRPPARRRGVQAAAPDAAWQAVADRLPPTVRMGTSSWTYPGWVGSVWAGAYSEAQLSKQGLQAYAQHPLLRTVCLDRAFYRALDVAQYAALAAQVPEAFRFILKAPAAVTDATVRAEGGRAVQANPLFLDPALALRDFVEPAVAGLGARCGPLVFQLSPLPRRWLADLPALWAKLDALLGALPRLPDDAVAAVEVRDPALLVPDLARVLRRHGATYCLGLHAKLPPLDQQLPLLRALWPGPLVARWNYHRRHGAYGYDVAEDTYAPFDRIVDADPDTRAALARVIAGTAGAGQNVFVGVSNKAEGSSPLTIAALTEAVVARMA